MAATADYNLPWAPKNTVLVADGFGNVASSEIPISTLGQVASGGSSIVANSTGITITDPFGGSINSSATQAGISAANSGGGFGQFLNGSTWVTTLADGNGNGLFLGPVFGGQQINLSNSSGNAGMVVTTGDSNNVFGNPLFLGVSGGVGITISPFGIFLNGIALSLTPPTAGQVLTASSPTAAGWVTPSGFGLNCKTVRSVATSFTQGGVTGPIALTFATPFADNNYTVSVTVLGDEVAPGTPTVTQNPSVGIEYTTLQTSVGAGVNVWITNNDSIAHTGIIHVVAIHD